MGEFGPGEMQKQFENSRMAQRPQKLARCLASLSQTLGRTSSSAQSKLWGIVTADASIDGHVGKLSVSLCITIVWAGCGKVLFSITDVWWIAGVVL